jgi:hypothetical protein
MNIKDFGTKFSKRPDTRSGPCDWLAKKIKMVSKYQFK